MLTRASVEARVQIDQRLVEGNGFHDDDDIDSGSEPEVAPWWAWMLPGTAQEKDKEKDEDKSDEVRKVPTDIDRQRGRVIAEENIKRSSLAAKQRESQIILLANRFRTQQGEEALEDNEVKALETLEQLAKVDEEVDNSDSEDSMLEGKRQEKKTEAQKDQTDTGSQKSSKTQQSKDPKSVSREFIDGSQEDEDSSEDEEAERELAIREKEIALRQVRASLRMSVSEQVQRASSVPSRGVPEKERSMVWEPTASAALEGEDEPQAQTEDLDTRGGAPQGDDPFQWLTEQATSTWGILFGAADRPSPVDCQPGGVDSQPTASFQKTRKSVKFDLACFENDDSPLRRPTPPKAPS